MNEHYFYPQVTGFMARQHDPEKPILRDQLAMAAMNGFISAGIYYERKDQITVLAKEAYEWADAMLAERFKT